MLPTFSRSAPPAVSIPLNERFPTLVQAIRENDTTMLDRLLDSDAEHAEVMRSLLLERDENGRNALLLAALHDWPRAVLRLLPLAPVAAQHSTPADGTAFQAMAFEVETHTDNGQRLIALDHLAVYEPDQALVTRTVQRYGVEHFPRWTVHREREALQTTLDGSDGIKPDVKGRARL